MFAVIYQFKLKPQQEANYQKLWHIVATYFIQHRGALGSCLHKGDDGLWVAYSRWPDKQTRDQSWSNDNQSNVLLPAEIRATIEKIQSIKKENQDLEQYDEICLEVVEDLL
jgi:hypothetical protein